jgi:hypothetical protein
MLIAFLFFWLFWLWIDECNQNLQKWSIFLEFGIRDGQTVQTARNVNQKKIQHIFSSTI